MPETVAANSKWDYDYVPEYDLTEKIVNGYLKEIWGNYKYFVEASQTIISQRDGRPRHKPLTTRSAQVMISDSGCLASSKRYVETVWLWAKAHIIMILAQHERKELFSRRQPK